MLMGSIGDQVPRPMIRVGTHKSVLNYFKIRKKQSVLKGQKEALMYDTDSFLFIPMRL